MKTLLPEGWVRPKGYSNGIKASGDMVFVAGVVGWDEHEEFQSDDLVEQFRQVLLNTKAIMAEGGAGPEHMARMTWYITDKQEYLTRLREVGQTYRDVMGKNYPVMACVEVSGLMEDRAKIEIETTCVISAD
ncbi:RidA family protein [Kordiimonas sp. SCSIO 12603]|uniref:RidA family protein n=1 Tax=Kordiimonas sp. SCSIO 12603 TaxID=2829596 RepID=UPI002202217A|nr:RidA family protein [Kordiimonas sp. SCSIO 12603]